MYTCRKLHQKSLLFRREKSVRCAAFILWHSLSESIRRQINFNQFNQIQTLANVLVVKEIRIVFKCMYQQIC